MINCGGRIDLAEKARLFSSEGRKLKILLLDSHRPLHHANLSGSKAIWVVDDGTIDRTNCPSGEEVRLLEDEEFGVGEEGAEEEEGSGSDAEEDAARPVSPVTNLEALQPREDR